MLFCNRPVWLPLPLQPVVPSAALPYWYTSSVPKFPELGPLSHALFAIECPPVGSLMHCSRPLLDANIPNGSIAPRPAVVTCATALAVMRRPLTPITLAKKVGAVNVGTWTRTCV
jgi:hypothetical protein